MPFRESFRRWLAGPKIRPWGLLGPVLVLLVCLPLLRPLRHPGEISDDEAARLATVRSLAEHRSLVVAPTEAPEKELVRRSNLYYSDQPPVFAILLAGAYWFIAKAGVTLEQTPSLAAYLLTLIGTTLPVAWTAALV